MTRARHVLIAIAFAVSALAVHPETVRAQEAADTAAVVLDVATQLEREGRTELAGALYRLILERWPGSVAAREVERRSRVARMPGTRIDRGGRVELIVGGTLYGFALGAALPFVLAGDDVSAPGVGLGLLLGGPGGFLIARNYADKSLRGEGHARAITFGGLWGTWQGFGWAEVFDIASNTEEFCAETDPVTGRCVRSGTITEEDASERALVSAAVLGGLAGIVAGDVVARNSRVTPGVATATNLGALWGTAYGPAAAALLDQDDTGDATLAWALVGGNLGLLTSAWLASRHDLTREEARLISIAGVAGAAAGLGADLILQPSGEDVAVLIPMATSAAGLALGWGWARSRADRRDEGGEGEAGALLRLEDGRLGLGTPAPVPGWTAGPRGERVPALRLELLRARF